MKSILKAIGFVLVCFALSDVTAQADPQFTQYMYNTISINPGYTGSKGDLEAILLHRSQWTGIDGSPATQSLGIHKRLRQRVGIGLSAFNDNLGPSNNILVNGNFSYQIPIRSDLKLSFGLNAGIDLLNIDWSKGSFYDANDPIFSENVNTVRPIVGSGAYLYSNRWYLGASASNFFNSTIYNDEERMVTDRKTQYYVIGGYVFQLSNSIDFKPAFLTKHVAGAPLTFDVSANFLFNDKLTAGFSYRNDDAVSALVGFQINPNFFIGYAYDYTIGGLSEYSSGSHEIMLRYSILDKTNRALSPRFF